MSLLSSALSTQNAAAALASSRQLILVVAPGRDGCAAQLQRFERAQPGGEWLGVGAAIPVSLGRSGLAWGRGLHPQLTGAGSGGEPLREKREGDGCAPAGIFAITALFGYGSADSAPARAAKLPYLPATANLKAIDDPASAHYNRIVDQSTVKPDWSSCEDMLREDERYALGAVVAHNAAPPVAGAGSCIFLHVWAGGGVPTAGCTAMDLADMTVLAGWLDAAAAPLLVQLAQTDYDECREVWGLPSLIA
jgi:L,D-peptidoglycan transpeptidase YkuD (ErfK/YbiS/YcfS/YnhG family)